MEIVILVLVLLLLVLNIILIFISIKNKQDEVSIVEKLAKFEFNINKEINNFKSDLNKEIDGSFEKMNEKIERKLTNINDRVNERLDQNFEKTNKTFSNVLERLSKIDEAQKKIDTLSTDIVSLQNVLTDKKSRGIFGEVNLKHILSNVFGENNDKIYSLQHLMSNGSIADCILYAPEPLGTIAIDSKFPLENYQNMVDKNNSRADREKSEKLFKADMKKHIDAISTKYIIPGETADQAILFLPAEAIFAEINAYHQDIIDYAYKNHVWITSPTTLISTLTVVEMIIKNMERDKYASIIHEELNKLGLEFNRYKERWDHLSKSIQSVNKDVENIHITTDKISKRFDEISGVEIDKKQIAEE